MDSVGVEPTTSCNHRAKHARYQLCQKPLTFVFPQKGTTMPARVERKHTQGKEQHRFEPRQRSKQSSPNLKDL